ncbi:hypothetical protein HWV62_753 [Athelia sp. TMB]|nr:hypothetical protein HWV62_753 [Athelia sp. TMB]
MADKSLGRTICLCFDGTGNKFGENSNIVRFFRALKKDDPDKQLAYYQAGIGTYHKRQYITKTFNYLSSALDQAVALDLNDHVKQGGAYTARALAGMLYKVGLLPPHNDQQVDFAFTVYQATDKKSAKTSAEFKSTFAIPVEIEFVGVWDTVSSVGIIPRHLPYSSGTLGVKHFRHALALDEHRARFRPNVWDEPKTVVPESLLPDFGPPDSTPENWVKNLPAGTNVKEVWFAGCHADIGGGSHKTTELDSLSGLPLRWMIKECMATNVGLIFDDKYLGTIGLQPDGSTTAMQRGPGSAPQNNQLSTNNMINGLGERLAAHSHGMSHAMTVLKDHRDTFAKIYDQLYVAKHWWILEVLPLAATFQMPDGTWMRSRFGNMGKGRIIPTENGVVNIHSSVKLRIENHAQSKGYTPLAANWKDIYNSGSIVWVD